MGEVLVTVTPILSTTVSLIPSWSGVNRSLGGVSGSMVEVTQPPTQPGGSAGATTPSKFSKQGAAEGAGLADGDGVGVAGGPLGAGVGEGAVTPYPRLYA